MAELKEKVKTFTNVHGEVMVMRMDCNGEITVFHEDCNEKFESILKFSKNYVLSEEEKQQIELFAVECIKLLNPQQIAKYMAEAKERSLW